MSEYPKDWDEIAKALKKKHGWKCERCRKPHSRKGWYILTIHHLVPDKSLCEEWNLAVLCQRCHLHVQAKVNMYQKFMFEHSEWMKSHVEGFEKWRRKILMKRKA